MDLLDSLAEEHIRQAAERGEFDNLPGAGQPLKLDDDRGVPPGLRAGYRLLKNAGCLPPELQLRHEIRSVEELLSAAAHETSETRRAERRLYWLRLQLAEQRDQRRPLGQAAFQQKLLQKLSG